MRLTLATCLIVSPLLIGTAVCGKCRSGSYTPTLRVQLLVRAKKDQDVRRKLIAFAKRHRIAIESNDFNERARHILDEMAKIDTDNRRWLKKIVDKHGWPGRSLVGRDGAQSAFLLVQHANHDLEFQERCLRLMQMADKGEVAGRDIALLTDRVRLAKGKKQLYGTQVEQREGKWQVRGEVKAPKELNQRRREMGLPPIEKYLQLVEKVYGTATNSDPQGETP